MWRQVWQGFSWFPEVKVVERLGGAGTQVGRKRRTSAGQDRIHSRASLVHQVQGTEGKSSCGEF